MKATFHKHVLSFKRPSGTSRGVLNVKETWYLVLNDDGRQGIGECGLLKGLSIDDVTDYETRLQWVCDNIQLGVPVLWEALKAYPSIQFGVEMAFLSLKSATPFLLQPSLFTKGKDSIHINGLVWMGTYEFMKEQISTKIAAGFNCIKLKIGAIDFEKEVQLLQNIRTEFSATQIEIRVDANGGFESKTALQKLEKLKEFTIHSIEQPIKQGQWQAMKTLCVNTPIPIALDEELIGVVSIDDKRTLLATVMPQYIILKPSLIGGYRGTKEWIALADTMGIRWWITSALESNIGLNAIAQFTYSLKNELPQGLGTGGLFTNNFKSPLAVTEAKLWYKTAKEWDVPFLKQIN